MNPADVMLLVANQISRGAGIPVYPVPMAETQDAPHGRLVVAAISRKGKTDRRAAGPWPMKLKLRLELKAQITGGTVGLSDTLIAAWNVTKYLDDIDHLEQPTGEPIANSRFETNKITDNDSVFEDPEDGSKASFEETWILDVTLPASMAD